METIPYELLPAQRFWVPTRWGRELMETIEPRELTFYELLRSGPHSLGTRTNGNSKHSHHTPTYPWSPLAGDAN